MNSKVFINTNLKFVKKAGNGNLVSFVTKKHHCEWRGCRQEEKVPKKIVVLAEHMNHKIDENKLYKCRLIPMKNDKGFVAIEASLIQHEAVVEVVPLSDSFIVSVKWGNRTLTYDPNSKNENLNNMTLVSKRLSSQLDIKDVNTVVSTFERMVNLETAYRNED